MERSAPPPPPPLKTNNQNTTSKSNTSSSSSSSNQAELMAKAAWRSHKLGKDGYKHGPPAGQPVQGKVGVYVLKKEPNERHFDMFSFLISEMFEVVQIDVNDIEKDCLAELNAVIFPGGSIFEVDKSLGKAGRKALVKQVAKGLGYFGVCAGAFLAGSEAYNQANPNKRLLGVRVGYVDGQGDCPVTITEQGKQLFGTVESNVLYYSHGCLFKPSPNLKNKYLSGVVLPEATPLVTYNSPMLSRENNEMIKEYPAAAVFSTLGEGRIIVFGPHPESTSGWNDAVRECIKWVAKAK